MSARLTSALSPGLMASGPPTNMTPRYFSVQTLPSRIATIWDWGPMTMWGLYWPVVRSRRPRESSGKSVTRACTTGTVIPLGRIHVGALMVPNNLNRIVPVVNRRLNQLPTTRLLVKWGVAVEKGTKAVISVNFSAYGKRRFNNLRANFVREIPREEFFNTYGSRVENRRSNCSLPVVSRLGFRRATSVRFGLVLFPVPARRTGQADFPHPALGKDSRCSV